ncbi:hypothetical protein [Streptomyces marincola]|uniref:hypothetical protein n=1 Tax=Streptomyces marincola TaxID=2878388 RepID=UPI001CF4920E|nr:hypothetical protein [Streptomyces marincola]UCM91494.1 hypothetical protein LC193_28055 [Streptomyces marincola]
MTTRMVRFTGGPLDGQQFEATEWTDEQSATGAHHIVDGWEARADYAPEPDGDVVEALVLPLADFPPPHLVRASALLEGSIH